MPADELISSPEKSKPFDVSRFAFNYKIYNLKVVQKKLRNHLSSLMDYFNRGKLKGPIFAMTHEMAANSLKALYKRIFFECFIEEMGLEDIPYEEWLKLFKMEIDSNQTKNFTRICRKRNLYVTVRGQVCDKLFRIESINNGVPTEIEQSRFKKSIEFIKSSNNILPVINPAGETKGAVDKHKEGGGMGIKIIIMCLHNLNIDSNNFSIDVENEQTIARLDLPLSLFYSERDGG